jgi:IS30 family transposase
MQKHTAAAMRGVIKGLLHKNCNIKEIAEKLGVHKSSVSREIKLRSTKDGYVAQIAQWDSERKKQKSKRKRKLDNSRLHRKVVEKLKLGWSPQQIAGRFKMEHNGRSIICHETIYA